MSNGRLLSFVNRAGLSSLPLSSDRNAAQALKFPSKPITSVGTQEFLSGPLDQSYSPNLRNIESEEAQNLGTFENVYHASGLDSLVDSDFDHTKTDSIIPGAVTNDSSNTRETELNYNLNRQGLDSNLPQPQFEILEDANFSLKFNEGDRQPNEVPYLSLRKNLGQQETRHFRAPRTGRFQSLELKNHEMRKSPFNVGDNQKKHLSRNISRSENGFSDTDLGELDGDDELSFEETGPNITPIRQKKPRAEMNIHNSNLDNQESYLLTDYNDEQLQKMAYSELETQSWEDFPKNKSFSYPRELRSSTTTLEAKINFYLSAAHKDKNVTGPGRNAAVAFYEQLTSTEWDQAGEIFMRKFTELMQKLQEKRREKRELTQNFESAIQAREKFVRVKSMRLDHKLQEMRTGGENLLIGSPRS